MSFHDDLSQSIYEIVQIAWVGRAYDGDGQIHDETDGSMGFFEIPRNCSPADVWEAFEPFFNTCDPTTGDPTAEQFFSAAEEVHAAQFLHFSGIATSLQEWSGDTADVFKQRLEELWWSAAKVQTLLEEFSTLYKGYQALIQGTQTDVVTLAQTTAAALRGYREAESARQEQANMLAATLVLSTLATVATAGAALPAAAAANVAAVEIIAGAAISVAQQGVQTVVAMQNLEVQGADPTEIMSSMFDAIEELRTNTATQAEAIIAGIQAAADVMRDGNFVPRVPVEIHQRFNPEEFRVPSDIMPDSIAASASHDPLSGAKTPAA